MSAPPPPNNNPQENKIHPQQIFIKLVLDSQNNINKLVTMQEQQMIYINTLFKQLFNEQQQQSTNPQTSTGTISTTTTDTEQSE